MNNPSVVIAVAIAACILSALAGYAGGHNAGLAEASVLALEQENHLVQEDNDLIRENASLKEDLQELRSKMDVREQQTRLGMATLAQQGVGAGDSAPVSKSSTGVSRTTKLMLLAVMGVVILIGTAMVSGGVAVAGLFGFPVIVGAGVLFVIVGACLLL